MICGLQWYDWLLILGTSGLGCWKLGELLGAGCRALAKKMLARLRDDKNKKDRE